VRTDVLSSQHTAYEATRKVYGSPRVHAEVQAQGIRCSRKRVACLMRTMGLCARRPRRWTRTTKQDPTAKVSLNLLALDLTARRPNQKWAGDSTAIWTAEGWLYLAARLDLFSRRVGGWAMAATQDESLVENALSMAVLTRHRQAGLLHHSERGCQYTSHLWWLLEVSSQNLEGLISSVTSYFETTHSNAIRFGESLALPSAKHGHHEAQSLLVGCILRRKTAGWYLLLILNRR
jgi:hypothetical protein